jgi:CRISPR/Cas system CMR-associated protein Cmr5 small subunit
MQNLALVRARNALAARVSLRRQEGEGDALAGYASLILNNGLLSTLAYSIQKQKQHLAVANAIAGHLHILGCIRLEPKKDENQASALLRALAEPAQGQTFADAAVLQRCTEEGLLYLNYLHRLAT